jgi:hypothetical protein
MVEPCTSYCNLSRFLFFVFLEQLGGRLSKGWWMWAFSSLFYSVCIVAMEMYIWWASKVTNLILFLLLLIKIE